MRSNTPGFVGARLTEARNARGISGVDLADMVGVSPQSISKYENGHASPRLDVLLKLSSRLQFPQAYFMRNKAFDDGKPVFWRGKLSAPVRMQDRAKVRLEWIKETIEYLYSFFDFPSLNVPQIPVNEVDSVDGDFLDDVASQIREHWGIQPGPMPDTLERLEANGVLVSRIHVYAEKLDAFSQWSERFGVPFLVLGRDKSSAVRQRFDALHELAHIVFHNNISQKQMNSKSTYKLIENQADKLASRLLLPEEEFLSELYAPSLDGFLALKERWGVSIAAMVMRCRELGLLSENETTRMWINLSRRGWRKKEPLDDVMPKEKPQLIRKSFEMLLSEGVQTISDIEKALPFPIPELEEIADLEPGTLGGEVGARATPKFKKDSDNVIQLSR